MQQLIIIGSLVVGVCIYFENSLHKTFTQNFKESEKTQLAYVELLRSEIKGIIEDKRALLIDRAFKGKDCSICHYKNNNSLPKGRIKYQYFKCYLRGDCRWSTDNSMPIYSKEKLSDDEIKELYKAIYE